MGVEFTVFDSAYVSLGKGIHLVEASAGTGKTYAIAMLVLRSVVELDIPIDKILIVTFTKAATEELRTRIRGRLVQARSFLLGQLTESDETLSAWGDTIEDVKGSAEKIQLALYDIDRAGIFTIHSFCQRMLQDQALESGQLFDVELLADTGNTVSQVVDDFWRRHMYPLESLPCRILTGVFKTPELLHKTVSGVKDGNRVEPDELDLEEVLARLEKNYDILTQWWQSNSEDLFNLFLENKDFLKKALKDSLDSWWQGLDSFFTEPLAKYPENLEFLTQRGLLGVLNGSKLRGEEKKLAFIQGWKLPEEEVTAYLQAASRLVLGFRVALAHALQNEVPQRLERQGAMSFDDLIGRLSMALEGDGGENLRRVLARRYGAALIDEFQDTDARQWHIFSRIFGGADHLLYLIGDPKQAIYRFRGADIHSYFEARKAARHHLTLEKNYRTHPDLVEEVNRLFLSRPRSFALEDMEYHSVIPAKTRDDSYLKQGTVFLTNMMYCQLPENTNDKDGRWTSGKAADSFLAFTIAEISRLLGCAQPVMIKGKGGERQLRSKDIAILVRTNKQAEEYVEALAHIGIPGVVASKRSVFQVEECRELSVLLKAIVAPGDIGALKTAMTLSWFNLSGNNLMEIWEDENLFEVWHRRFLHYHQLWDESGFLTMITRLLMDEAVFITLATQRRAERRIANIHHLVELVQEAESAENLGMGQTLQWLLSMMHGTDGVENGELRLDSDEEAVRIMTMHGSKGLEFAVVFCPFLWYRSVRLMQEKHVISCYDDGIVTDLGSEHFERRRILALEEELAEDLRLLYVALTRAAIRCYTMWADVKPVGVRDSFTSALGYLLFPDGNMSFAEQQDILKQATTSPSVDYILLSDDASHPEEYHGRYGIEEDALSALTSTERTFQHDWQMSSYSAMASHGATPHFSKITQSDISEGDTKIPVSGLPAGANFGNLIHDCCEEVPFNNFTSESNRSLWEEKCRRYGVDAEPESLKALLENIVATPLIAKGEYSQGGNGYSLKEIPEKSCLKEMNFYFHLSLITTQEINTILKNEATVTPLSYRKMQGFLTGFVDLLCEHDGKYYILDYKTNYLGEALADYSPNNLEQAMASHNYGLQYWIYTVVVHRHLKNILPNYNYEQHFGGVMYLFVRGMVPSVPGSGVFYTLPDARVLAKLCRCFEGGA